MSSEDRCAAAYETLLARDIVKSGTFFRIVDPPSRYSGKTEEKTDRNVKRLSLHRPPKIDDHRLLEPASTIVDGFRSFIRDAGENVVVDISSFPKRFFFPLIKSAVQSDAIDNLVVTYTVPQGYPSGPIAENPSPWAHLPLFAPPYPEPKEQELIVGIGFEPLGLPDLLQNDYQHISVRLLFPFPPGPPTFQRTWEFVRRAENSLPAVNNEITRVDLRDVSETFAHLIAATDAGKRYSILAPYGPKPMSLAMCLFATACPNSSVYYTQPTTYHPDYSVSVSHKDGEPETYAYCITLNRKRLYTST